MLTLFARAESGPTVINSKENFKQFIEETKDLSPEEKLKSWESFEKKYQSVYEDIIFNRQAPQWERKRHESLNYLFQIYPVIQDETDSLFDQSAALVKEQVEKNNQLLMDYEASSAIVFFVPSGLTLNGVVDTEYSFIRLAVIIGVDAVAAWKNNIHNVLAHEMFHQYHFNKIATKTTYNSIVTDLWTEGLATYFSHLSNPDLPESEILMDQELATKCQLKEYTAPLAKEYLQIMDKTLIETEKREFYRNWFLLTGAPSPKRQGYCLGYRAAQLLHQKHSLQEMTGWGEEEYNNHMREALKALGAGRDNFTAP